MIQAFAQRPHRAGQAAFLAIADRDGRLGLGLRVGWLQRFLQGEQFDNSHRHDRPVQFGEQPAVVAAVQLSLVQSLFEP